MGDRPLRIQDDFETMQRLMNELEYEKKQYEKEIEREMQLTAELDCKTEAAKQEEKLNKEATRQQDEEAKLLNKQCVQNMHNYSSLQEACDILSEQEKNLSRRLKELRNSDETAREKKKTTVDHYEAIYKTYMVKYEKYPLAVQRKEKEGELANWEENYNEAKLRAEETAKKLTCLETSTSQKAATSVNEFPVFKNQNEFIIKLAKMKLTFDELSAELERKTDCCEELKKTTGEKVKAKRQMEEEKRKDELKRIAEERASDERNIAEKRIKAGERRQEEKRQHLEEQRGKMDERQMEDDGMLIKQNQRIALQLPFQRDGFRPETTSASQPSASQATTSFHQRLPPKIFLPARQMSFPQKQDNEVGVFRAPLPPKELRFPATATGKRPRCVDSPVASRTLVARYEATTAITAGLRQKPYPDVVVATATPVPPKQPLCLETPVAGATQMQPKQPSCTEASAGMTTVLPKHASCPEAGGGIAICLKNLSIHGQTDQNFLMETEDEPLPPGFNFSSSRHTDSNRVMHSGFNQQSDVEAAEDQENLMLSSAPIQQQEANEETRKESCLDLVSTETPMSTDQDDQFPSLEATASAAGFVCPEISVNVSHTKSNWRPLQMNSTIGSFCDSVMLDDPVSQSSMSNADCVVTSSIPRSVSSPLNISCSLVSETVANNDCPTLTVTSSTTCSPTMTSSDVHLYCPTSEETAMASQVSDTTSVASAVARDCPTVSMSAAESEFCTEESAATDFSKSLEQPSGWSICGTKTPVIPIADNADSGKFIGSCSPIVEFNFEEEMAKLKKLSESPALNLYSGRRMFLHSGQSEIVDKSTPVRETGGTSGFMSNFGQFESDRQTKESEKATNPDFGFGNLFSFGNRSDSNEIFSFFGGRGNEAENSSKSGKDGASSSDDIFKLFGGSDADKTTSRQKETGSDGSGDIFNMFASSGNTTANSSKNKSDDAGGFFTFGAKKDSPVKSQFKFF